MKTITKLFIGSILVAALSFGQTALSTTTLGAAITTTNGTTVTLASTSTMQSQGQGNLINTCFFVDTELFGVVTVVDSTHVVTQPRGRGCGAIGMGARPMTHASGAKVYFANTATNGSVTTPAASYISKNNDPTAETFGSCTATNELVLPKIYSFTGDIFYCGSSGQWINVGKGTMNTGPGVALTAYCTTTVGSAETDWLNDLACSGATSSLPRNVVTKAGVLYGLTGTSSANFVGTGGSVLTVVKNGVATAIVCAPTAATKTCSDFTHSVAVVPGDTIAFSFLSSTSDTAANVIASVGEY